MATTVEGRRLTETHRIAQVRLGAQTIQQMLAAWALLDPVDLDGTLARWLRVVLPIIGQQRTTSTRLAAGYVTAFRALELDPSAFVPVLADPLVGEALITSLTITGPVAAKMARARGETLDRAMGLGQAMSARSAMRLALDGGRQTLLGSVRSDQAALGWARATSRKPCSFCAMLASRGPIYRGKETADFEAHDGCACEPEPVYSRNTEWPPGATEHRDLWDEATAGHSGADARNAFRRAYEAARR